MAELLFCVNYFFGVQSLSCQIQTRDTWNIHRVSGRLSLQPAPPPQIPGGRWAILGVLLTGNHQPIHIIVQYGHVHNEENNQGEAILNLLLILVIK